MLGNITQGLKMMVSVDGVQQSQGQLKKLDSTIGGMAKSFIGVAAATAVAMKGIQLMNTAIAEARESAIVQRMVAQQLQTTGNAAGIAADELFKMASGLQAVSNMGDEGILRNLTLPLLTFKAISGDVFKRTQQAAIDLNAVIGDPNNPTSLRSSAIQLGKALQDPIQGLSALRRVGISFSNSQIETIKNLAETGRLMEAQSLILDELQTQFGGAAQAGINSSLQLKNAWGDYLESVGAMTLPMLDGINLAFVNFFTVMSGNMAEFAKSQESMAKTNFQSMNDFVTAFALNADAVVRLVAGTSMAVMGVIDGIFRFGRNSIVSWAKTIADVVGKLPTAVFEIAGMGDVSALKNLGSEIKENFTPALKQAQMSMDIIGEQFGNAISGFKEYGKNFDAITSSSMANYNKMLDLRKGIGLPTAPEESAIGSGADSQAIQDYYSEIMLLNRTAEQEVIDSHNEMRASLYEYLKANEKDQNAYNAKLKIGMAEISESETAKLKEITDARLKEQQIIIDAAKAYGIEIMALDDTELESVRAKYSAMRDEARKHYDLQALSANEYNAMIIAINAAEAEAVKNIETQKLATKVDALRQLAGFENDYMALRFQQLDIEIARLREAGLTEVQIAAWVAAEKKSIAEEAGIAHVDMANALADEVTASMERIQGGIESSLGTALYDLVVSTKSAGEAIRDLWKGIADSVIREITRMIAKMAIMKTMQMVIGMPTGGGIPTMSFGGGMGTGALDLPSNTIASYTPAPPSYISNGNNTLATKLDRLITAIETNPPQIFTQVIDGIQMYKAVERSRMVANAL